MVKSLALGSRVSSLETVAQDVGYEEAAFFGRVLLRGLG